jgi:hypothetical protein
VRFSEVWDRASVFNAVPLESRTEVLGHLVVRFGCLVCATEWVQEMEPGVFPATLAHTCPWWQVEARGYLR